MEQELYESSGSAEERLPSSDYCDQVSAKETNEACLETEAPSSHGDSVSTEADDPNVPVDTLMGLPAINGINSIQNSGANTENDPSDCQNTAVLGRAPNPQSGVPLGYPGGPSYNARYQNGLCPVTGPPHPNMPQPASDSSSYFPSALYEPANLAGYSMDRSTVDGQHYTAGPMHMLHDRHHGSIPGHPPPPGYLPTSLQYQHPGPYQGRFGPSIPGHPHSSASNSQSSQPPSNVEDHRDMPMGQHEPPQIHQPSRRLQNINVMAQAQYYQQHLRTLQQPLPNPSEMPTPPAPTTSHESNSEPSQTGPIPSVRQIRARNEPQKTSEKKHQCNLCSMSFERPSNLQVHRRKHTGERPFACEVCGKDFTTKSNTTRHEIKLHPQLRVRRRSSSRTVSPPDSGFGDRIDRGNNVLGGMVMNGEAGFIRGQTLQYSQGHRRTSQRDQSQDYVSHRRSVNQSQTSAGNLMVSSSSSYRQDEDDADEDDEDEDEDYVDSHGKEFPRRPRRSGQ